MNLNYNPKKVSQSINGTFLTGMADGQFHQYEKINDDYTPSEGADGEVDYSENASNAYQVTVVMKHTSPSNKFMLNLAQNKTPISYICKDSNPNGETVSGVNGRIMKIPNKALAKEIGTREWVIHFPSLTIT